MRSRLLLALVLAAPTSVFALADDVPADRQVVQIQVQPTAALVLISPPVEDLQGCVQSGTGWLEIDLSADRNLLTAALVAATAKQKVGFQLSGCGGDYPLIQRVDVAF